VVKVIAWTIHKLFKGRYNSTVRKKRSLQNYKGQVPACAARFT
jgi:hypothetical protein